MSITDWPRTIIVISSRGAIDHCLLWFKLLSKFNRKGDQSFAVEVRRYYFPFQGFLPRSTCYSLCIKMQNAHFVFYKKIFFCNLHRLSITCQLGGQQSSCSFSSLSLEPFCLAFLFFSSLWFLLIMMKKSPGHQRYQPSCYEAYEFDLQEDFSQVPITNCLFVCLFVFVQLLHLMNFWFCVEICKSSMFIEDFDKYASTDRT